MKFREIRKQLEQDGWYLKRQKGSHAVYHHSSKRGIVILAGKEGDDVPNGTLSAIKRQAGLK